MNKIEALKALQYGKKLTHHWFSPNEWVIEDQGKYIFEDGCQCHDFEFWADRTDESWNRGWSIFNE